MVLSAILLLFALSIFTLAKPAWDAGLKVSSAVGATSMIVAVVVFKLGYEWLSIIPYLISAIAVIYGQYQMKKFGVGPYQDNQG
jgi:hypothetical protein